MLLVVDLDEDLIDEEGIAINGGALFL